MCLDEVTQDLEWTLQMLFNNLLKWRCHVGMTCMLVGEEGASHGFNETQASTAVVDSKLLKTLLKVLPKYLG